MPWVACVWGNADTIEHTHIILHPPGLIDPLLPLNSRSIIPVRMRYRKRNQNTLAFQPVQYLFSYRHFTLSV